MADRFGTRLVFSSAIGHHWVLIPVGMARFQHFSADAQLNSINFVAWWPNGLPLFRLADLVVQKSTPRSPLIAAALAIHRAGGRHLRRGSFRSISAS